MTYTDERATPTMVDVVLQGGPAGLPGSSRIRSEPDHVDTIKVPYHGGYEHFRRTQDAGFPAVFRWTMRTRVAE